MKLMQQTPEQMADARVIVLPDNMRVVGLPRKSKNGTRFYVIDGEAHMKRQDPAKGYAFVVRTRPDGTVVAQLESGGSKIAFNTKNKKVWPNGGVS